MDNTNPAIVTIIDRNAKTPWEKLGITTKRWNEIAVATTKNIKAAEEIAMELQRKLSLVEKLAEISKVNPSVNELALLSAAIITQP